MSISVASHWHQHSIISVVSTHKIYCNSKSEVLVEMSVFFVDMFYETAYYWYCFKALI